MYLVIAKPIRKQKEKAHRLRFLETQIHAADSVRTFQFENSEHFPYFTIWERKRVRWRGWGVEGPKRKWGVSAKEPQERHCLHFKAEVRADSAAADDHTSLKENWSITARQRAMLKCIIFNSSIGAFFFFFLTIKTRESGKSNLLLAMQ